MADDATMSFLMRWVLISLTGVMMPGALTAATLNGGTRSASAGALVALGHGVVEFPLMGLLFLGMGVFFENLSVQAIIALVGGAVMLWLGGGALAGLRKPGGGAPNGVQGHPLWLGILLTASNPYFLMWWATIGLGQACEARRRGLGVFAAFAVVHWLCDLVWLWLLSGASFAGARLLGGTLEKGIVALCGTAMLFFGIRFIYGSIGLMGGW